MTNKIKKNILKNKIMKKRLKEFAETGNFEVNFADKNIMGIGLKYGESKYLETLGFPRKEQIRMLDFMQDNPKILKKVLRLK